MRRIVRTNRWHAVAVKTERNEGALDGLVNKGALDIRVNSMPDYLGGPDACSAYLTPKGARRLAAVLIEAARTVEAHDKKRTRK